MNKLNRRNFIAAAATLATGTAAAAVAPANSTKNHAMVHQVYFWLKNPDSKEEKAQLIAGIKNLSKIETIRMLHVGTVAPTGKRSVIDDSWSVSELVCFDSVAGEAAYQTHPLHVDFVNKHKHLWSKVVVYDAIEA